MVVIRIHAYAVLTVGTDETDEMPEVKPLIDITKMHHCFIVLRIRLRFVSVRRMMSVHAFREGREGGDGGERGGRRTSKYNTG